MFQNVTEKDLVIEGCKIYVFYCTDVGENRLKDLREGVVAFIDKIKKTSNYIKEEDCIDLTLYFKNSKHPHLDLRRKLFSMS